VLALLAAAATEAWVGYVDPRDLGRSGPGRALGSRGLGRGLRQGLARPLPVLLGRGRRGRGGLPAAPAATRAAPRALLRLRLGVRALAGLAYCDRFLGLVGLELAVGLLLVGLVLLGLVSHRQLGRRGLRLRRSRLARRRLARRLLGLGLGRDRAAVSRRRPDERRIGDAVQHALDPHLHLLADE